MQMESDHYGRKGNTRVQWAVSVLVNIPTLTCGLQGGWISPMSKVLQSDQSPVGRMNDYEISLLAGIPSLAAVVGILTSSYIVDAYGRKTGILVVTVIQLFAWILTLYSKYILTLLIARLLSGFSAGATFHVVPMYVKEISQDNVRGILGSLCTMFQNLGILVIYALGGYLEYYIVMYIVIGLPVVTLLALYMVPESPSFSVKLKKIEEASATIAFLRGLDVNDKEVKYEVDFIQKEREQFENIYNLTYLTMFKDRAVRRGFVIMAMIFTAHGLNGTFAIINFAAILLVKFEMKVSTELQTLTIPVCMMLGTIITMVTVEKLGRKVLLGTAFGVSSLTYSILGSTILLQRYGWSLPEWLPILVILVTVSCYGAGIAPVVNILVSEIFNFQVRAKAMACICIQAWSMSFIQLMSFTAINITLGVYTSFFMFSVINLFGVIIVVVLLPETRGKSMEQIEAKLKRR